MACIQGCRTQLLWIAATKVNNWHHVSKISSSPMSECDLRFLKQQRKDVRLDAKWGRRFFFSGATAFPRGKFNISVQDSSKFILFSRKWRSWQEETIHYHKAYPFFNHAATIAGLAFLAFPALFLALKSVETELVKKSAPHVSSDIRVKCWQNKTGSKFGNKNAHSYDGID
jgi:hypothetical protein